MAGRGHFNPRSPHGERLRSENNVNIRVLFQSTLPARGATILAPNLRNLQHISIHAPRTGSDVPSAPTFAPDVAISIHAPRTGSDEHHVYDKIITMISVHAPRTGSDAQGHTCYAHRAQFQSTLPARGATARIASITAVKEISIHAPRTGSDKTVVSTSSNRLNFNPRSPHGERRELRALQRDVHEHFNPRSPHGERRFGITNYFSKSYFNPRSPHGERQLQDEIVTVVFSISIHAPRTGSDTPTERRIIWVWQFQSTLPARGATTKIAKTHGSRQYFNPRSPHGERPTRQAYPFRRKPISIHAPRTGSDALLDFCCFFVANISIHAPRTGSDNMGGEKICFTG